MTEEKWKKMSVHIETANKISQISKEKNISIAQVFDDLVKEKYPESTVSSEQQDQIKMDCRELSYYDCCSLTKDWRDSVEDMCAIIDMNRVIRGGSLGGSITAYDIANHLGLSNFLPK